MKRIFNILAAGLVIASMSSCNKLLDTEGPLDKVTAETLLTSDLGVQGLLATLYNFVDNSMGAFSTGDRNTFLAQGSRSNPTYSPSVTGYWNYTNIRTINVFIETLDECLKNEVISPTDYNTYKGEALFIRAYLYFLSVRYYGGVPIVDRVLDNEYDGGENAGLYIPRSTEKETWDWVIAQLDEAAALLPEPTEKSLRANKYVAWALQSRVALWAASTSKYWEGSGTLDSGYTAVQKRYTYMEPSYANAYYEKCITASKKVIDSGKYKLYGYDGTTTPTVTAATTSLIDLFQDIQFDEYIFGRSYKNGVATGGNGIEGWAPSQTTSGWGVGTGAITLNMVEEYDNYDNAFKGVSGQIKTRETGGENYCIEEAYNHSATATVKGQDQVQAMVDDLTRYDKITDPFKDKDARFRAWIVYPGSTFRGETIHMQAGLIQTESSVSTVHLLPDATDALNDGVSVYGTKWYPYGGSGDAAPLNSAFYDILGGSNQNNRYDYCFGIKKFLDQSTMNNNTQTPWYDIRYAEILLNYAEAAAELAEAGVSTYTTDGKTYLNAVRHRAGFTDDVELSLNEVYHQIKCEFIYENHWQGVLWRTRSYYRFDRSATSANRIEGQNTKKYTLYPMVDLTGSDVKYVFVRGVSMKGESSQWPTYFKYNDVRPETYYSSIQNFAYNKIDNNNTK